MSVDEKKKKDFKEKLNFFANKEQKGINPIIKPKIVPSKKPLEDKTSLDYPSMALQDKFINLALQPEEIEVVAYHYDCPDGVGAMTSVKLFLDSIGKTDVIYIGIPPGSSPPFYKIKGKNVLIVDVFPKDVKEAKHVIKIT